MLGKEVPVTALSSRTVRFRSNVLFFAVLLLSSCASLPLGGGKEPQIIVIRNRSGADIDTVTLREAGKQSQASRFGSISPVPLGVSQEYIRPTDPPPFPRTIEVEWVDREGTTHVRELSVSKALRSATGSRGEAIVFEIWPDDDVLVFIEKSLK
jgi:hypothetical protein